jgi:hypothetical protein
MNQIKVLGCQTGAHDSFDPQRLSGELSNHHGRALSRAALLTENPVSMCPTKQASRDVQSGHRAKAKRTILMSPPRSVTKT